MAADRERVPLEEIFEDGLVDGGKIGQIDLASELEQRAVGFGRRKTSVPPVLRRPLVRESSELLLDVGLEGEGGPNLKS